MEIQAIDKNVEKWEAEFTSASHILFFNLISHLEKTVTYEARNYASKNLPNEQDESLEPYLTSIRGFYGNQKKQVAIKLQGGIQNTLGNVNVATVNLNIEEKKKAVEEETATHDGLDVDRRRIHLGCDSASFKKQNIKLVFIGAADCAWTISGFLKRH